MNARGTGYIELAVKGRWALSILTEGWTEKEVERLYRGDDEAREHLLERLTEQVLNDPDDVEMSAFELNLSDPREIAPATRERPGA